MSILNAITVPTIDYGTLTARLEARVPDVHYEGVKDREVWSAEGRDRVGHYHKGYGADPVEAVVDVLMNLEMTRRDEPEVTVTDQPPLLDRLFGPGSSEKAGFRPGDLTTLPAETVPAYTPPAELTPDFWEAIREEKKIVAIKVLRDVTSLSLKSSKALVDYIIPSGKVNFTASGAAEGTVIRIRGAMTTGLLYVGWVLEKASKGWMATGDESEDSDWEVQGAMDGYGFDILYMPRPESRVRIDRERLDLRRSRLAIESDRA